MSAEELTSIPEMAAEAERLADGTSAAATRTDPVLEPPAWLGGDEREDADREPEKGAAGRDGLPPGVARLNEAGLAQLRDLGMSPTQARRVLNYRQQRDGFESVDELDDLPGFPRELLDSIKDRLTG